MAGKHAKDSRGEITRQRIVEQAAPLFNQHGYAGTSMSDLMLATGLEKGGLYRHFDSKEDLAAAAFDYAWDAVSAPRWRGLDDCPTAIAKLQRLIENFAQPPRTLPGGCPLLNTAIESDDGNRRLRGKAKEALGQWRKALSEIVCHGQRSRELRSNIDAEGVAVVIIAALEGAIMMSRLERSREPLHTVAKHLTTYLQTLEN